MVIRSCFVLFICFTALTQPGSESILFPSNLILNSFCYFAITRKE